MSPNFGSTEYAAAFQHLPDANPEALRQFALEYLEKFDPQTWYASPVTTILKGNKLVGSTELLHDTKDAFGKTNGHQYMASPTQVSQLKEHLSNYQSPYKDLRPQLRRIEQKLLSEHAGFLIGNQALDFGKQDGVTEIEEAIIANAVERNLNDLLMQDEHDSKLTVSRKPIYVSCVSNFTNFLDLFRKTIRSLEVGVPCVVLGRSNTAQHSYRWTELLMQLMNDEDIQDMGMLTYMSCTLDDIRHILRSCRQHTGNLYATCSRALAADMMSGYPNTVASTGGPNTLLTTEWTEPVKNAIRVSATIECAGQCTALRHCVIPGSVGFDQVKDVFRDAQSVESGLDALRKRKFDGVFVDHEGTISPPQDEYSHDEKTDVYFKIGEGVPKPGIDEYWRKVCVDFSQIAPGKDWEESETELFSLVEWLNKNQPITLAVNARYSRMIELGLYLFERTGLVVYTFGSTNNPDAPPGLTCQARPQEAEVFGEFPPRDSLTTHTKYPVIVPSSNPSYDSTYTKTYLESLEATDALTESVKHILECVASKQIRGYCIELLNYLRDATKENPKRGFGSSRTALWGLQRPPVVTGLKTHIRFSENESFDDLAPILLLFYATNARDQMQLSVDPGNDRVVDVCSKHRLPLLIHTEEEHAQSMLDKTFGAYNYVEVKTPMKELPLVGQFVSLYFPLGHVKSTKPNDEQFVSVLTISKKWLKMHD